MANFKHAFVSVFLSVIYFTCLAKDGSGISIDMLINPSGTSHAALSPDGKHLALIKFNGHRKTLMVGDVDTFEFHEIVYDKNLRFFEIMIEDLDFDQDPIDVIWINNDLLGVNYTDHANSFDLNGNPLKYLGKRIIGKISTDAQSDYVLTVTNLQSGDLAHVDARTGTVVPYRFKMSGNAIQFALDKFGHPRAVTMVDSAIWKEVSTVSNWYKPPNSQYWEKLAEFGIADDYWTPLFVPDEDGTLLVRSRAGTDHYGIYRYDTKAKQLGEKVISYPGADILSVEGINTESLTRVRTSGMLPKQIWFDPVWARLQKLVDEALPERINLLSGEPSKRLVVFSYGAVDPGSWYLMEVPTLKLSKFGNLRDAVQVDLMRPMQTMFYKADDGLTIPAYLTLPKGNDRNLPTVIMIHGSPNVRDTWGWDEDVQFLASRGYAVLQPQFRGSYGFGLKFQMAGYSQWGLAMQDDITAGVKYLIQQGITNPKKVCIFGASYGGYAALWGLVKNPELYRCGISFAGVTDLELMLTGTSESNSNKITKELMLSRIGDIRVNKQRFDQVSPLKKAKAINAPVLLMHGELDQRVPLIQGERMHDALSNEGKSVEWITFPREGHGLYYLDSRRRYFKALEQFLDKFLDSDSQP